MAVLDLPISPLAEHDATGVRNPSREIGKQPGVEASHDAQSTALALGGAPERARY